MYDALTMQDLVVDEFRQRTESGFEVDYLGMHAANPPADPTAVSLVLDELDAARRRPTWPYVEPADLESIIHELPPQPSTTPLEPDDLHDQIYGAWLGRVAGCMLGKPLERGDYWTSGRIRDYLLLADSYPLSDYVPVLNPMPDAFELHPSWPGTTRDHITGAVRDDDIDYTLLNLLLLEAHGPDLTTEQIGDAWLRYLPCLQTYTGERAAYRNLVTGLAPPQTATHRNPYREWIGAAIRADMFGYVHPGRPRAAARLAYRDARLSHVANGLYAEMWVAALVAAAFTESDPVTLVEASRRHIPRRSRLAEAVEGVVSCHQRGMSWEAAIDTMQRLHGHYTWVHAINNACVVVAALLWGGHSWADATCLAVQAGWDTDSNGATVGSIMGAALGSSAIPDRFVGPLQDTVRPGLFGWGSARISDLAIRTCAMAAHFAQTDGCAAGSDRRS
jgi:ADP-ribosylglycohydrolase